MLKNKLKVFILLFTLVTLLTTVCFATEPATTNEQAEENTTTSEETTTTEQDIHSGDLYLFDNEVVMNQLVDGNVYIMGNNVSVTGQINGNLFVLAQNFTLEDAYVRNSVFLCANSATFNGACTDLYAACNSLSVSYDSYIARDSRITCDSLTFKGLNTRDMFVSASSIDFGSETDDMATIYGNLTYTSNQELTLGKDVVSGETNFTPMQITNADSASDVLEIVAKIISALVFSVVIYYLVRWFTPKFEEGISEYTSAKKIIITFFIGLAAIICIPIICLLLVVTNILSGVAIALGVVYGLLISISFAIFCLYLTKVIGKKVSKLPEVCLFLIVTLVLSIVRMLPYISTPVAFIMGITGFGILVTSLFRTAVPSKKETAVETITEKEDK